MMLRKKDTRISSAEEKKFNARSPTSRAGKPVGDQIKCFDLQTKSSQQKSLEKNKGRLNARNTHLK